MAYSMDGLVELDRVWCLRLNRASRFRSLRRLFRTVSRLGDGVFWYALMLALLVVYRAGAVPAVLHMIVTGVVCTLLYKWLKQATLRPRPFQVECDVVCAAAPLDRFSFPSGHTLHAMAFSVVAVAYYPALVVLLLPFTLMIAASRVVLGLHYPSDVFAGAAIGTLIAGGSLALL